MAMPTVMPMASMSIRLGTEGMSDPSCPAPQHVLNTSSASYLRD